MASYSSVLVFRYITYGKEDEAIRCIQSVHGFILDGRPLRWVKKCGISSYESLIICFTSLKDSNSVMQGMLRNHKILSCMVEECGMVSGFQLI